MARSTTRKAALVLAGAAAALSASVALAAGAVDYWWSPGDGQTFPAQADFPNESGQLRVVLQGGPLETKDHAFFAPIGPDGRACVTCHQPSDGMSLSAATAKARWEATKGADPLFAAYDGSNCPTLPQKERASHSLLIDYGLIRVQRSWPPRDMAGKPVKPDFEIEVVRDPWGCNTGRTYGLAATEPSVSVYRRPRPVANLKYMLALGFAYDPKQGMPLPRDPETGQQVSGNLMADGRAWTLNAQMRDAAATHLQFTKGLTAAQIDQILDFEKRIFAAQQVDRTGGALDADGAVGGPAHLVRSEPGRLGSIGRAVWAEFQAWEKPAPGAQASEEQMRMRESIARGAKVFRDKTFLISDSAGINSPVGFGNPVRNSCVFCHNMTATGADVAPGQVDLGTTNAPFADPAPHLPLFRIRCTGEPHPHYGKTILTSDPGYALTTGRCADVGKITLQSLRGLPARAPYFSNGSAKDLRGVVDYYDRRYRIGYTDQEKQDLVNLMSSL